MVSEKRLFTLKKHCPSPSAKLASTEADKVDNLLNLKEVNQKTAPNEATSREPNSPPQALYNAIFGKTEAILDTQ